MTILMAVLIIICGCFYGMREGMIMIQARDYRFGHISEHGIRAHDWFKYYHTRFIPATSRFLPVPAGVLATYLQWNISTVLFLSGAMFIGWQCEEWFYSWTRYARWIPETENVMGFWRTYSPERMIVARILVALMFIATSLPLR